MISFSAIFHKLNGPQVDGGYRVTFDVSEDEWKEIAVLPALTNQMLKINVELKNGTTTKMDELTLKILDEAFALGCSDPEACLMANISPTTLYNYQNEYPEYVKRKEQLKETPVLLARTSVVNALKRNPQLALQFLERKKKAEFAPRTELTGPEGTPLGYAYSSDVLPKPEEPKLIEGENRNDQRPTD